MARIDEDDKKPKKPKEPKQSGGRSARLAAALRENLRRRKAQERRRGAPTPGPSTKPARVPDKGC